MTALTTIAQHAAALAAGRTTSAALTDAALARIQAPQGEGARAFTRVYDAGARAAARAADELRGAGLARSAIDGLPISIKDLFDVAGETTMAGSVARRGEPAAVADAPVVQRLRAAGAVIVGRTNMTEFAFSGLGINPHYGTPLNAWDRASGRIPGGSSSGAAVSVTDGMAVAGIGSDTGGSVRIPAALCGLVGFKPTARRVPLQGALPLSASLDSIGPIAASVDCCARLDAILSGHDLAPRPATLRGLRLAVPLTVALDGMDDHVAASFRTALSRLSAAGVLVQEVELPAFAKLAGINAKGGLTAAEAWWWHRDLVARAAASYDPRVVSRILRGKELSAADYLDLRQARAAWTAEVGAALEGFDALVLPTVPVVAPTVAELTAADDDYFRANGLILRNPTLINFLDGCALSVPCHAPGTAPAGFMIAGGAMSDRRVLSLGLALEAILQPR
ncbi:amidase [Ramlibacter sp.]|uniref:amidase n=1 Tax=Ramlibacter sp. TaxID=1917967 RepID=UPI002BD92CEF|nr:amidase [Ramlibacter sp.]HWI82622.1 amidase [Ramlibacter sp.]